MAREVGGFKIMARRLATAEDEPFVRSLLSQVIIQELGADGWPEALRVSLVEQQYRARRQGIRAAFPEASEEILMLESVPVGWAVIDRGETEIRLVDFVVLASHRGRGIGASRLRELLEEADRSGKATRLSVVATSPAVRLYERMGFQCTGGDGVRLFMERPKGQSAGLPPSAG